MTTGQVFSTSSTSGTFTFNQNQMSMLPVSIACEECGQEALLLFHNIRENKCIGLKCSWCGWKEDHMENEEVCKMRKVQLALGKE
jgi:hypothetical protein